MCTPNYAFKPIAEQALRSNQAIVPQRLNAALELFSSLPLGVTTEMTQEADASWMDDNDHPIPFVNALDVLAKWEDGTRKITIIIANPLDDSPYSQKRLLNKMQNYVAYVESEDYAAEFGRPTPDKVFIVVHIHKASSPMIFELLGKCVAWVGSGGASLVVEQF